MEKDLIFLSETGITDTVASRMADYAKLAYTDLETEINSLSFCDKSIESLNGSSAKPLVFGVKKEDVMALEAKIERIGQLKSLDAWLREAVKAHQSLIRESNTYSFAKYVKEFNIELPQEPELESTITESDVIATFDIKKRNRYYSLEAHAATIGKFIHKDGPIDSARKQYYNNLNHPRTTTGSGADTVIYTYSPSVDKECIEKVFYSLQQTQAKYQSELNSIKSEIMSRITNDSIDKRKAFNDAKTKYDEVYSKIHGEYALYMQENAKRIAKMKIVIPNSLRDIYDEVSKFGA